MRIIAVTLGSLLAVATIITATRIWGLGQSFIPFEHAFFKNPPQIIVKVETLEQAEATLKIKADAVLWLDVRFSREKTPFILPVKKDPAFLAHKKEKQKENPTTPIFISGRLAEYPWEQINEFYKDTPALKEFYVQFPQTRFVLNIIDNVSDAHTALVSSLEGLSTNDRTFIQSDTLILMTTIKELKPEWVYGTSVSDLTRLLSFDSIWILPSTQFKGDVFVAPFKLKNRPAFNDDILLEMRRRYKRIYLGPIESKEQFDYAKTWEADGYITDNLTEFLKLLGESPAL